MLTDTPKVPEEFVILELCKEYHWSYNDYLDTPLFIIEIAKGKMNADRQRQKQLADKQK